MNEPEDRRSGGPASGHVPALDGRSDCGPSAPVVFRQDLDGPVAAAATSRSHGEAPSRGVSTPSGSLTLAGGCLVLVGDIDTHLCSAVDWDDQLFRSVDAIDARRVTFLGCPAMTLIARVAHVRGPGLPLWASGAAARPLVLAGLDRLVEIHPASAHRVT